MKSLKQKDRQPGVGQGAKVWIVEMRLNEWRWVPTVGIALTRVDGEPILKDWQARFPNDEFRLRKYWREGGVF